MRFSFGKWFVKIDIEFFEAIGLMGFIIVCGLIIAGLSGL